MAECDRQILLEEDSTKLPLFKYGLPTRWTAHEVLPASRTNSSKNNSIISDYHTRGATDAVT